MAKIINHNYGGFKRRKELEEQREKERQERMAKTPKMSYDETVGMINYMSRMALRQQMETEDRIYERRKANGGW